MPVGQAPLDNTMSLTFGNEKSSILSVLPHYLLNNGFLLNRQAELDLQAFPNGVWEREKISIYRIKSGEKFKITSVSIRW
jgi:hypothetical protein